MKLLTPVLISGAVYIAAVHAQRSSPEPDYHYTPGWSSWAPVTVYATVTESTTVYTPVPTTIYVTVHSTTTTSTTALATTEKDVTIIESFTTTTPVTATEVIKDIITSQTEQVTITLCTSRDTNPTYTAAVLPLPSDYTWGCPPGYLCKPKQENCNFEVGLPSQNYYCAPDECVPAAALPAPQVWNPDIYGNASPANDPNLKWNVVGSYFDMNPSDYGFSYEIFVENQVITYTYTTTIIEAPTAVVRARQAQTSVPAACYPWCNNCLLEAQAVGKTPALCASGSAFEIDVSDCEQCIAYHKSDSSGTFVKIAPQFQQFINYCAQISSSTIVSTATNTHASTPVPVVQTSSSKPSTSTTSTSLKSSSTVTATLTVAGPTTATIGAQSTPITSTTVTPSTPSTWTTTLTLTLSGPTNISISAYTPDTTHYSTSTLTSTMTLTGPTTITYSGSALPSSATPSSKATAPGSGTSSTTSPPATFSGGAVPTIRPNGIWTLIFIILGSILACMVWI